MPGMLAIYRALDLTDEKGFLCGKVLADLGCDVIKIEKPGGDSSRDIVPFWHDIPDREKSLSWFAYNANKRGITLDIETADGQDIFRKLVRTADFVIESFQPGHMDKLGFSYSALSEINPRLIITSITPFGQTGPYKAYKGSDIVGAASSGFMYLVGDRDRPPVRITSPQSYLHASIEAAAATLVAHYHRELTGEGQYVDASIQASMIKLSYNSIPFQEMFGVTLQRAGPFRVGLAAEAVQRQTWPCADGFISFTVMGGKMGANTNHALVWWMEEEGMADDYLKKMDWDKFDMAAATQNVHLLMEQPIGRFFLKHTKAEILEEATRRGIIAYPVSTIGDLLHDRQLEARDFWTEVDYPELDSSLTHPGTFFKAETASQTIKRAPLIGEHNEDVYIKELGLYREDLIALKQAGVV